MTQHKGTSVLLLADGRQLTAGASLSKDDSGTWSGSLTFPDSDKTPELLNLVEGRLIVNGREGSFVRPDTSDWIGSPAGQFRIHIEGNGDAPF